MLGDQFDGDAIIYRIGLRKVSHRLDQEPLAVDVARIGGALAPLAPDRCRRNWDCENLGHKVRSHPTGDLLLYSFSNRPSLASGHSAV